MRLFGSDDPIADAVAAALAECPRPDVVFVLTVRADGGGLAATGCQAAGPRLDETQRAQYMAWARGRLQQEIDAIARGRFSILSFPVGGDGRDG